MFICFTGIDGGGKSTLARALVDVLEDRGIRSKYVHSRFRPLLLTPLTLAGRVLFLRGRNANGDYTEYSKTKRKLFRNRFLSRAYGFVLLVDYFVQASFQVGLRLLFGTNIVCDRYVYDTVINDLAVDFGYSPPRLRGVLNRYMSLLPKPDIAFLVDVPEEVAFGRKHDVPSIDFLKERRSIYLEVCADHNMTVLDGSKDLASLILEVREEIFRWTRLRS